MRARVCRFFFLLLFLGLCTVFSRDWRKSVSDVFFIVELVEMLMRMVMMRTQYGLRFVDGFGID